MFGALLAIGIIMAALTIYAASRPANRSTRTFFVVMVMLDLVFLCLTMLATLYRMGG